MLHKIVYIYIVISFNTKQTVKYKGVGSAILLLKTCVFLSIVVQSRVLDFHLLYIYNTQILIGQFRPGKWSWFCQICIWLTTSIHKLNNVVMCCRIWSWSPMSCEKHGPGDSVDKNWGRKPRFLSLPRLEGHVFHTVSETMIKSYYSMFTDWFFPCFIHRNMNVNVLNGQSVAHFMVDREITLLIWTGCQGTQMNNNH